MPRYVLTGAPGAGKTSILHLLAGAGFGVVAEAATDLIAAEQSLGRPAPEEDPEFIARITAVQCRRQLTLAPSGCGTVVFDRSPVCTLALARFLGRPVPAQLGAELDRIAAERVYEREVFFVRSLGFVTPTAARRISFADSVEFERLHEQAYRERGFELIEVPAGPLADRAALVSRTVQSRQAR